RRVAALVLLTLIAAGCDDSLGPTDQVGPSDETVTPVAAPEAPALVSPLRIVFSSNRDGQYDLYKMDASGKNVVRLTNNADEERMPAWSFDNKRLAVVRPRRNAANRTMMDIYIVNADGTNGHWALPAVTTCDLSHPSWSPDGSRLTLSMSCGGTAYVAYL